MKEEQSESGSESGSESEEDDNRRRKKAAAKKQKERGGRRGDSDSEEERVSLIIFYGVVAAKGSSIESHNVKATVVLRSQNAIHLSDYHLIEPRQTYFGSELNLLEFNLDISSLQFGKTRVKSRNLIQIISIISLSACQI